MKTEEYMEEDGLTLEELGINTWRRMSIKGELALYLDIPEDHMCNFKIIRWVSSDVPEIEETNRFELVCKGAIIYDGIRHVNFGTNEEDPDGYLFYINYSDLGNILIDLDREGRRLFKYED